MTRGTCVRNDPTRPDELTENVVRIILILALACLAYVARASTDDCEVGLAC